MVNAILAKLEVELKEDKTSERQFFYVLVKLCKLIDTEELAREFEALKLHCDWTVHTTLSLGSAKRLLRKLNYEYSQLHTENSSQEAIRRLGEKLGLKAFQREFHEFLDRFGVDQSACNGNWWFAFLYYYSRVIQDCPLESGTPEPGWAFDRVVLVDPDMTISDERLYMQWEFLLAEEQVGLWLVHHNRDSLGKVIT